MAPAFRSPSISLEALENREVPAIVSPGSGLTIPIIAPTSSIAESAPIGAIRTPGVYKVTSPDGTEHVRIDVGVTSTTIRENGALIWRGKAIVGEVLFSPNSQHLAIALDGKTTWTVIEDGAVAASNFASLSQLNFSADGSHLAFVGQTSSGKAEVVEDGAVLGGAFTSVQELQFSSAGDHLAAVGYESQSLPKGPVPMFVADLQYEVSGVGEWGYRSVILSPDSAQPASPEVLVDGHVVGGPYQTVSGLSFNSSGTEVTYTADGSAVTVPVS
jgi:hypothetical protein